MARTVTEIYNSILADKVNHSELDELNSSSKTALYKLLAYIFAFAAFTLEKLFDQFKIDVDEKLKLPAHNARWYQQQALKYQHGDELAWNDTLQSFEYLEEDEDKQIVARAAAVESGGRVTIKVVNQLNGELQPLTSSENAALQSYLNRIKDAGVRISSRSWLPDDLVIDYEIIYDPLILTSSGCLISDSSIKSVEDAIQNYIEELDFNGRFSIAKLEDAIQTADGVVDFNRIGVFSRHGSDNFAQIFIDKVAESGYMKLHENSIINYIASNV